MAQAPLLAIRGVKTYYGKIMALRGVDLDVNPGEIGGRKIGNQFLADAGSPQAFVVDHDRNAVF